ncbi:MAG: 50S ribosomal protein L25/general stress protein Ctc [Rikenellaceae bacterium]
MKSIQIAAALRSEYGKKATKEVRRSESIPCILYGGGENVSFSISEKEAGKLIYTPSSFIVELDINGKKEKAVLREVQYHPVREQILHMDFFRVIEGKPVSIAVPVRLEGTAAGVKVGGKLTLSARKLVVSAMEANLPDEIVVDVTPLELGKTIFVGDLQQEGVKFVTPATTAVCAVRVTRATRSAQRAQ